MLTARRIRVLPFVISTIAILFLFQFTAEDAYIVARYAYKFVTTGQLVFNNGERISALTSPLQAIVLAGLMYFSANSLVLYKIFSLILLFISVWFLITKFKDNIYSQLVILVLIAISPPILLWTVGGLETPLLLFLITSIITLIYSTPTFTFKRLCLICILIGLAFITRYDSVLFTSMLLPYLVICSRKKANGITKLILASLVGVAIPLIWLIFSYYYYGDIFPTSFWIKIAQKLVIGNFLYVLEYLILTCLMPFLLLLLVFLFRLNNKFAVVQYFKRTAWLHAGLILTVAYATYLAGTHMMFSFRPFVPYIPAAALLLADITKQYTENRNLDAVRLKQFQMSVSIFCVAFAIFQLFQVFVIYQYSMNGFVNSIGEYRAEGINAYMNTFMATLGANATEIRNHWEAQPASAQRFPRIYTFAAGILPFNYPKAYIFEQLVSFRRQCPMQFFDLQDITSSADYVHILTPRHGSIDYQLRNLLNGYQLVSSHQIDFDGHRENIQVYYNPYPAENPLPATLNGKCKIPSDAEEF